MKIQVQTSGRISSAVYQPLSGQGSITSGVSVYVNTLIPVTIQTSFTQNPQYIATLPIVYPIPNIAGLVPSVVNGQEVSPFV